MGGVSLGPMSSLTLVQCCIQCGPCLGSNYTSEENAEHCSSCFIEGEKEMWGNDPLVGSSSCVPIPHKFSYYSAPWAIPSLIFTCIGLLCVLFTGITFGVFWKHDVVRSSGREQMIWHILQFRTYFHPWHHHQLLYVQ